MTRNGPEDGYPVGTRVFLTKKVKANHGSAAYQAGTTGVIVAPPSQYGFYRVRLMGAEGFDRVEGVSVHPSKLAALSAEMIDTVGHLVDRGTAGATPDAAPEPSTQGAFRVVPKQPTVFISGRRIRRLFGDSQRD